MGKIFFGFIKYASKTYYGDWGNLKLILAAGLQ